MTRVAAIGPELRANLRRLKAEFTGAFEAIEDPSDRASPEFLEADALYRVWIKAIDEVAMALLDDIDALEATDPRRNPQWNEIPRRAVSKDAEASPEPDDAGEFGRARSLIGAPEPDVQFCELLESTGLGLLEAHEDPEGAS